MRLLLPFLLPCLLALCLLPAPGRAERWHVEDRTNGIRFEPPITAIGAAPSDPNRLYAGTANGRIYFTEDGGQSWEETTALTAAIGSFSGARRTQVRLLGGRVQRGPAGGLGLSGNRAARSSIGQELARVPRQRYAPAAGSPRESIRLMIDGALAAPRNFANYLLPAGNRETRPRAWRSRFGKRTGWWPRISYKGALASRTRAELDISWISVHPTNPRDVLVGSAEGLMRSTDGGYSWPMTLSGATPAQRGVNTIARNPKDPDHVLVGTEQGFHQSFDGGDTFEAFDHPYVASGNVRAIAFDLNDPNTFYVGMSWALLKTTDGGKRFKIIFREPNRDYSFVQRVTVDPYAPERIFIGTHDGLGLSVDGGETFQRAGGPDFMGEWITSITPTGKPGHFLVSTWRDLYQTQDGGKTFQVVLYGATQWAIALTTAAGPGSYWLATQAELLLLQRDPGTARVPRAVVEEFKAAVAAEPSLNTLVRAAQERAGVFLPDVARYRSNSRWSHVLPRLTVDVRGGGLPARFNGGFVNRLPTANSIQAGGLSYAVFGRWDLRALLWRNDQGATAAYRLAGQARRLAEILREQIGALYTERRRLLLTRLIDPRPERRTRLLRDLRFEELTAHLNALTGDLLDPFTAL